MALFCRCLCAANRACSRLCSTSIGEITPRDIYEVLLQARAASVRVRVITSCSLYYSRTGVLFAHFLHISHKT